MQSSKAATKRAEVSLVPNKVRRGFVMIEVGSAYPEASVPRVYPALTWSRLVVCGASPANQKQSQYAAEGCNKSSAYGWAARRLVERRSFPISYVFQPKLFDCKSRHCTKRGSSAVVVASAVGRLPLRSIIVRALRDGLASAE